MSASGPAQHMSYKGNGCQMAARRLACSANALHRSQVQTRVVVQANAQIVECRRILKWTYAYGFYKFDTLSLPTSVDAEAGVTAADVTKAHETKQGIDARKALFEFLQNDAESSLEQLSNAMERDMKRFYHADEFWRLTKRSGGDDRRLPVRPRRAAQLPRPHTVLT